MKIGYLGPKGTFSYEAAEEYSKGNNIIVEYKTIPETIMALENEEIDNAVIPIENSLQGCVTDAIDTLMQNQDMHVKVIDELFLEIKQNLMSKKICKIEELKTVYSHPQAIAQCSTFIETYLKHCNIVPVESTANAAKKVSKSTSNDVACIGNIACLKEYGLNLVKENIHDSSSNKTRFWILSKNDANVKPKTKMSIIFSVQDKPGALYKVLETFDKYHLNLTKIESRPAKTILGEYIFWIDVEIKNTDEKEAIKEIESKGIYLKILGKY